VPAISRSALRIVDLHGNRFERVLRSELREGDTFVDATAGQLQDALVAAAAVGARGRVVALEASPLLWAVTSGRPVVSGHEEIDLLLNERITVYLGEHTNLLRAMPTASADVVYFDPMVSTVLHALNTLPALPVPIPVPMPTPTSRLRTSPDARSSKRPKSPAPVSRFFARSHTRNACRGRR
jgi:hypothetical protein